MQLAQEEEKMKEMLREAQKESQTRLREMEVTLAAEKERYFFFFGC